MLEFPLLPDKYARIDNQFVFNARYRLPAREQKIILYILSKVNPNSGTEFHKQRLSVSELKDLLVKDGGKYGSFYSELSTIAEVVTNCKITFPTRFEVNGVRLKGSINWFQHCIPVEDEHGELHLEFVFSEILKPFLIDLKEYVRINVTEVFPMRSGYSIRMFQILKAEFDRFKEHRAVISLAFSLDDLKQLLGIDEKANYSDFKNFRVRVLDPIRDEINQFSKDIQVDYDYLKTGKKITGVRFNLTAKNLAPIPTHEPPSVKSKEQKPKSKKSTSPPKVTLDLSKLTRAQGRALDLLTQFGVFESIALKQILPSLSGSELLGFEDIFIQFAIFYFKENAQQYSPATFVVWWHDKKVFDVQSPSGVWSALMEQLAMEKKRMQKNEPAAYENRLVARTMTNSEFEAWYRNSLHKNI